MVYDVRIAISDGDEKEDAIAVSLNHRDGYSVIVMFSYKLDDGGVVVGDALAEAGAADIFTPPPIH